MVHGARTQPQTLLGALLALAGLGDLVLVSTLLARLARAVVCGVRHTFLDMRNVRTSIVRHCGWDMYNVVYETNVMRARVYLYTSISCASCCCVMRVVYYLIVYITCARSASVFRMRQVTGGRDGCAACAVHTHTDLLSSLSSARCDCTT